MLSQEIDYNKFSQLQVILIMFIIHMSAKVKCWSCINNIFYNVLQYFDREANLQRMIIAVLGTTITVHAPQWC